MRKGFSDPFPFNSQMFQSLVVGIFVGDSYGSSWKKFVGDLQPKIFQLNPVLEP